MERAVINRGNLDVGSKDAGSNHGVPATPSDTPEEQPDNMPAHHSHRCRYPPRLPRSPGTHRPKSTPLGPPVSRRPPPPRSDAGGQLLPYASERLKKPAASSAFRRRRFPLLSSPRSPSPSPPTAPSQAPQQTKPSRLLLLSTAAESGGSPNLYYYYYHSTAYDTDLTPWGTRRGEAFLLCLSFSPPPRLISQDFRRFCFFCSLELSPISLAGAGAAA